MASGHFGDLLIYLTYGLAIYSGATFLLTALGKNNLINPAKRAFYIQIVFITIAMGYLWYLFFSHDFSIKYVYDYSSRDLPFFYLVSSLWAGQDGTYLLWLFLNLVFGLIIVKRAGRYTTWAMFFLTIVNIFLLTMLLTLSPFRRLPVTPADGSGLNPLLQDPWMVIHPPVVFIAFAMAGVTFSVVMAAMAKKDYSEWLKISFPLVAVTAGALAIGNVLGGYWAYKTLGWGGYWAWDPVENTSFIPWVISLGLIHGMLVEKRSGALRRINLLLAIFTFLLVVYGTFLTRSGVLANFSVHSFVDLGANAVLVSFLLFYLVFGLGVFFATSTPKRIGTPLNYNIFSREFILFIGMVLLFALGVIVLFWSSLPLITQYLTPNPTAPEPSTYNTFAFPFAIIFSLFLIVGPHIRGGGKKSDQTKMIALVSLAGSIIIAGILFLLNLITFTIAVTTVIFLTGLFIYMLGSEAGRKILYATIIGMAGMLIAILAGVEKVSYLLFFLAASAVIGSQIQVIAKNTGNIKFLGGHLNHIGFGLMLIGILASSETYTKDQRISVNMGDSAEAMGYEIAYMGMTKTIDEHNNELILNLYQEGDTLSGRAKYFRFGREGVMKKPHIHKTIWYDLYISPLDLQHLHDDGGLVLAKNESWTQDDLSLKFIKFEIGPHEMGSDMPMSVGAVLEVNYGGEVDTVTPRWIPNMESVPIPLFDGSEYTVIVENINADRGLVQLSIPGITSAGPQDRAVFEVTKKPGINILWIGTIIVFVGMGLSAWRRFDKKAAKV